MGAPYGQSYSGYPQTPPVPSRPLGVAILAVLIGIFGFLFILAGALLAAFGLFIGLSFSFPGVSVGGLVLGIVLLIIGLIILGLALGLWHQRLWALVLTIIVVGFYFVSNVISGIYSLGTILALILVIYLIAVHRHFL